MNVANAITILRILLIPVFVVFAVLYSRSVEAGQEDVTLRLCTLAVFAVASISDALDGYVARRWQQITPMGQTLDPVADKALLLSAMLVLGCLHWQPGLPLWFAVLVVLRDVLIITGYWVIRFQRGQVAMRAITTSKMSTFLQMTCVCWALLDFWSGAERPWPFQLLILLATAFTLISAWQYGREAVRQLRPQTGPYS